MVLFGCDPQTLQTLSIYLDLQVLITGFRIVEFCYLTSLL